MHALPPTPPGVSFRRSYDSDDEPSPSELESERHQQRADMQRRMNSANGAVNSAERELEMPIPAFPLAALASHRAPIGTNRSGRSDHSPGNSTDPPLAARFFTPNRSKPQSALSTQRSSRRDDGTPLSVRFKDDAEQPHAASAAPISSVVQQQDPYTSIVSLLASSSPSTPHRYVASPKLAAHPSPSSSLRQIVEKPSPLAWRAETNAPQPPDPIHMLEDWHAANPSTVSTARPFILEEIYEEMPMTSRAIAHDRGGSLGEGPLPHLAPQSPSPDASRIHTARSLNTYISPKSFRGLAPEAQRSAGGAKGMLSPILALPMQLENSPPPEQTQAMLNTLSDVEFRRVMERWIAVQSLMQREPSGGTAASSTNTPSRSPLHTSLLESYLSLHPWSHPPSLVLRSLFRFLSVPDLVLGAKGVCRQWKATLGDRNEEWSTKQLLVWPEARQVSNSDLLIALGTIPALRSIRFEAQNGLAFSNGLRHAATMLPKLQTLEFDQCTSLRIDDFAVLLPPKIPSASDAPVAALQVLSLIRCFAVDQQLMDLLGALPHLRTLELESLQPMTASRATGLHWLSSSLIAQRTPSATMLPPPFPHLTSLSLSPLSSDACLTHIVPRTQLKVLKIRGCISNIGIESLCIMQQLETLHVHCMYQLPPANSSASVPAMSQEEMAGICDGSGFAALEQLSGLTELNASVAALSPAGFTAICALKSLKKLALHTRPLTPSTSPPTRFSNAFALSSAAAILAQLHVLSNLTELDLSGCQWITDEQISFLTHQRICATLRSLSLAGVSSITDISAYWLSKLTKLQWMDLRGTEITSTGYREFYRPLAACIILRYPSQPAVKRELLRIPAAEKKENSTEASAAAPSEPVREFVNAGVQTEDEPVEEKPAAPPAPVVVKVDAEVLTDEQATLPTLLELSQSQSPAAAFYMRGNLRTVAAQTKDLETFTIECQTDDAVKAAFEARIDAAVLAGEIAGEERVREMDHARAEKEMARAQVLLSQLSDKMAQSQTQLTVMPSSVQESSASAALVAENRAVPEEAASTASPMESHAASAEAARPASHTPSNRRAIEVDHAGSAPRNADNHAAPLSINDLQESAHAVRSKPPPEEDTRSSELAVDVPFSPTRPSIPTTPIVPPTVPTSPFLAHLTPKGHPSPPLRAKATPPLRTRAQHSPSASLPNGFPHVEADLVLGPSVLNSDGHQQDRAAHGHSVLPPPAELKGSFFSSTFTPRGLITDVERSDAVSSPVMHDDEVDDLLGQPLSLTASTGSAQAQPTTPIRLFQNGQPPFTFDPASLVPTSPEELHTPVPLHRSKRTRTPKGASRGP